MTEFGYDCYLHLSHSPAPLNAAVHHVLPKSWGGPDTLDNKVTLCPTGHENVHTVLNWFVSFGSPEAVPSYLSKHVGDSTMALALRAWNQRPAHTPYT